MAIGFRIALIAMVSPTYFLVFQCFLTFGMSECLWKLAAGMSAEQLLRWVSNIVKALNSPDFHW